MKLTAKQLDLLNAMRKGVAVHYVAYPTDYYFRADTMQRCTQAACRLLELGLAEPVNIDFRGHKLVIAKG